MPARHAAGIAPRNVLVARNRTEPSLALDPRDDQTIIAATNPDYYHQTVGPPATTFVSTDNGTSWTAGAVPLYSNFSGLADPSLATDSAGHIYYLYMGETPSYCGESGNAALLLARSSDAGHTFAAQGVVDVDGWDDKPSVAVDSEPGQTFVYATFTRWLTPDRQVLFTRSAGDGRTFATAPRVLYASPGANWGALPVAGPHGRVYVLWAHYDSIDLYTPLHASIMMRVSNDFGRTFGPPITISTFTGLPRLLMPGAIRLFVYPTAAVDPRSGALYVAWVRARALPHPAYAGQMEADVMLTRTRDGGRSWTQPVALNDTPVGDRFMPTLSVGADGLISVAFYDRRVDGTRFGLYGIAARDEGARLLVWPNKVISAALSSPYKLHYIAPGSTCVAPGRFMGDYIDAVTARDGALDVMWTDTTRSAPGESDIMFARVPDAYLRSGATQLKRW